MTLNKIRYNHETSTYLLEVCFVLKIPHTQNMFLNIESTGGYTHHKQVKGVCYIEKGSWLLLSPFNLASILSSS
jgi:hypothetical protein